MLARTRTIVALILAAALLAACSAGSTTNTDSTGTSSAPSTTLAVGFSAEPENLDFTTTDGAAIPQALLLNVYEGLVRLDDDGAIVPLLATEWIVSPDRKTYDFTLRSGVTFSNGDPFDAAAVKFSIERVQTAWKSSLKTYMDVVDRVDVVSPTEVKVVLNRPSNDWLYRMTTRIGAMFSPTGVANLATKPIGTGPYIMEKWVRGDSITLTRNPDYWGQQPPITTATLRYFKDPTALNNALLTGGVDIVAPIGTPDTLTQFENNPKFTVLKGTTNGEVVLSFNNGSGPLRDKRIRQAVNYAIDRQALIETTQAGYGTLIGSMVPPTDPWYEDLSQTYPYDPAKAKELLAEAGKPALTLRLRIPNLPYAVSAGQVIKSQLAQVGITAQLDVLEFPARWLDVVFTNTDYDMSIVQHVEARDLTLWGNPKYYFRYDNPTVAKLLVSGDAGTPEQQVADFKQAARILAEDAAADWLYLFPYLVVTRSDVTGVPTADISEGYDIAGISRT